MLAVHPVAQDMSWRRLVSFLRPCVETPDSNDSKMVKSQNWRQQEQTNLSHFITMMNNMNDMKSSIPSCFLGILRWNNFGMILWVRHASSIWSLQSDWARNLQAYTPPLKVTFTSITGQGRVRFSSPIQTWQIWGRERWQEAVKKRMFSSSMGW